MPTATQSPTRIKCALALRWLFLSLCCLLCGALSAQEVVVDLLDPTYENGVLSTSRGGVLTAPGLRLQGRHLIYTRKEVAGELVHTIEADGDLMLEYGCNVFVGRRLTYDFVTCQGKLACGRGTIGAWYAGGRCIDLEPDGTFIIRDGYLTTCENIESKWQLQAQEVEIHRNGLIRARKVGISVLKAPIFWIPSFETKLDTLRNSPLQTRIRYGGATGSVLGLRYCFLDKGAFKAYGRGEYFFDRGPGVGIETTYCPADRCTTLSTQSYVARDRVFLKEEREQRGCDPDQMVDPENQWRYRVAGCYEDRWRSGRTCASVSYDWLSDPLMPSDFRPDHFNLETAHRSHFTLKHATGNTITKLWATPRLNTFQTINQRLPQARFQLLARTLGQSGVLWESRATCGYMNYVFARQTADSAGIARSFHAKRLELTNAVYRPFRFGSLTAQPELGLIAVGYSNSQGGNRGDLLLVGHAGLEAQVRLHKWAGTQKHILEPYLRYDTYTKPTVQPAVFTTPTTATLTDGHYVFSYEDGYSRLNQLRMGVRNQFCCRKQDAVRRQLAIDTYAYAFFGTDNIPGTIPRLYTTLTWSPNCWVTTRVIGAWNFAHNRIDHLYPRAEWTISDNAALSLEYRYRSGFAWRKANADSFFPDAFHPEPQLEASGLSYRHNTLLTHAFFRVDPALTLEWDSRHSWNRRIGDTTEENYNEWRITMRILLGCRWILKLYYEKNQFNNGWSLGFNLGPSCNRVTRW